MGGLGDTGQPGPKKVSKVNADIRFHTFFCRPFSRSFAEMYAVEKEMFFRSLARVFFFGFLHFWDALVRHFGKVFAQILVLVWRA